VVHEPSAYTEKLEPGDIISVVNGGKTGPLSGHVATVVQHQDDQIIYVSGNAAGVARFEGAVRIEEVKREQPLAGYSWQEIAKREHTFTGHKQDEKKSTKAAAEKRELMRQHFLFVQGQLNEAGIVVPSDNLEDPAVLAGLLALVLSRPADDPARGALIGNVQEIIRLRAEVLAADASSASAKAAQATMLADGGLPVNRDDPRFIPGRHAPIDPSSSWVVEVIKASALTQAQVLASGVVTLEPTDPMLEKGPRLVDQCPDAPPEVVNQQAR
jgi:hypothetical protein